MRVKLSRLEIAILTLAFRREGQDKYGDVFPGDVLEPFYGFQPRFPFRTADGWAARGHAFSRKAIGATRYSAARASIGRAMRTLEAKGLLTLWHSPDTRRISGTLTTAGKRKVQHRQLEAAFRKGLTVSDVFDSLHTREGLVPEALEADSRGPAVIARQRNQP